MTQPVRQFFDWCEDHRLGLDDIEPIEIVAYIKQLDTNAAKRTLERKPGRQIRAAGIDDDKNARCFAPFARATSSPAIP
jgi:hypothetical protein